MDNYAAQDNVCGCCCSSAGDAFIFRPFDRSKPLKRVNCCSPYHKCCICTKSGQVAAEPGCLCCKFRYYPGLADADAFIEAANTARLAFLMKHQLAKK